MAAAAARLAREDWRFRDMADLDADQVPLALEDPDWRLRHLYWIIDKEKKRVRFTPNEVQEHFLATLWFRNIVLKARQRGFSTLIQLMMLDTCLFNKDTNAAVVAHDLKAATNIFDKIKFAYDNLPEIVREGNPLITDSKTELALANHSSLQVSVSVRSGTIHFLHISEFAKICAKYPEKAREIITGSLPAVPQTGIIAIESTAEGQEGAFHDMVQAARESAEQQRPLSKLDYRFHFAPWWDADEFQSDPETALITPADNAYFARIEPDIGAEISPARRAWYVTVRRNDFGGDRQMMMQEYPATPDEAFEQAIEGTYLAEQLAQARREGRVCKLPYNPAFPVNTWWDLGHGKGADGQVIWFHQRVGIWDNWINFLEGTGEAYAYWVGKMQAFGYVWGKHYLPHDGNQKRPGLEALKTSADMLGELGLNDIEIVPRIDELKNGIQLLRNDFVHYRFDEELCADGLKHLGLYRKEWNERLATWSDHPRKDGHDHAADAIRQKAQWYAEVDGGSKRPKRRNRSGMVA